MPVSSVSSSSNPPTAAPHSAMGKDDFLKLMMAQLAQQDPTAPVDSSAFVAQLAQFSNLELMQNQSQSLDSIVMAQTAGNQLSAAALVGKDAIFHTDTVAFDGTTPAAISGTIGAGASQVTVTVADSAGKTVRTLQLGAVPEGPLATAWDGRDDNAVTLPKGTFTVSITAADTSGKAVSATNWGRGRINGVSFEHGYAELILGDRRIKLSDVLQLNESEPTP